MWGKTGSVWIKKVERSRLYEQLEEVWSGSWNKEVENRDYMESHLFVVRVVEEMRGEHVEGKASIWKHASVAKLVGETGGNRIAVYAEDFSASSFLLVAVYLGRGRGPGSVEAVPGTE